MRNFADRTVGMSILLSSLITTLSIMRGMAEDEVNAKMRVAASAKGSTLTISRWIGAHAQTVILTLEAVHRVSLPVEILQHASVQELTGLMYKSLKGEKVEIPAEILESAKEALGKDFYLFLFSWITAHERPKLQVGYYIDNLPYNDNSGFPTEFAEYIWQNLEPHMLEVMDTVSFNTEITAGVLAEVLNNFQRTTPDIVQLSIDDQVANGTIRVEVGNVSYRIALSSITIQS